MKTGIIFGTLLLTLLCFSCEKTEYVEYDVDEYIQQLHNGKYDSYELPEFTTKHISGLLEYRNDTTIINNFPHNPISSLWLEECRLGIFVLWTIESIRVVEIQSDSLYGRFPSLNPYINITNPDLMMPYIPSTAHKITADAYYDWWHDDSVLEIKLERDPLTQTPYSWH